MIETKSEIYAALQSSVGQPLSQELVNDIMYYILSSEQRYNDEIAKWIENTGKIISRPARKKASRLY